MACGEFGEGKMSEPTNIIKYLIQYFKNKKNKNKFKALVTAGPTHEYIDPVRYITNRSTGKQGYEIAKSLSKNGFETTLVSGPTNLDPIEEVNIVNVSSAKEMFEATLENLPVDVAVFSAAVADWKIKDYKENKIKKNDVVNLSLEKNIDILKNISNHNSLRPKMVIGFAAETNNLIENSKKKLNAKNCDWIVGNDISDPSIGFGSDFNKVTIFYKDKKFEEIPRMKKSFLSQKIVDKIIAELN